MKLIILTTCYNAKKYIWRTIQSLQAQNIQDWHCYITDDMSTDGSADFVEAQIKGDDRFTLIRNESKMYQPGNYWQVLQREEINDEDICITVDGDDWFPVINVLERLKKYYEDPNIWVSCGQFVQWHGPDENGTDRYSKGFTTKPANFKNLRNQPWRSSHLRTFKAWLFRRIEKEDLIAPNGCYWEVTGDLAFMYPILEMAGIGRTLYTEDINYVYNVESDLNDFKVNYTKQMEYANLLRAKKPYDYITEHKQ